MTEDELETLLSRPTLDVAQAAKALGIGRSLAFEAVARGEIPSTRIGRRIRVLSSGIRKILHRDVPEDAQAAA